MTETTSVSELTTPRLRLRQWTPADEPAMAAINSEPEVARYLNRPVDGPAVAAFYGVIMDHWRNYGFGPWAVESRRPDDAGSFLGFVGLAQLPPFLAAAGDGPELGWRLAPAVWGQGLATEAAVAARDDALVRLGLSELISVIHPDNVASQRVAAKLGMHLDRHVYNSVIGREVDVWTVGGGLAALGRQS